MRHTSVFFKCSLNPYEALTNTASSSDPPVLGLSYALLDPPSGMAVYAVGVIAWYPDETQGPSTNLIVTVVTDAGSPALSATNSVLVIVQKVNTAPVLPSQVDLVISSIATLSPRILPTMLIFP